MADWGDSDEELGLEALEQAEQQALASRQAQPATAPPPPAPFAAPAQQQTTQPPRPTRPAQQPQPAPPPQQRRDEGPPRTAAELCRRCHLFRSVPPRPQRPTHDKCPGVYGRGCGGGLQLVRWGDRRSFFWACSKPDCAYREFPPPRKLAPELSILLERRRHTVAVGAAPGAEEAVAWCGGVAAVLSAAGVDLRCALSVPAAAPAVAAAGMPVPVPAAPALATSAAASAAADEPAGQPANAAGSAAAYETMDGSMAQPACSHSATEGAAAAIASGQPPAVDASTTLAGTTAQEAVQHVAASEQSAAAENSAAAEQSAAAENSAAAEQSAAAENIAAVVPSGALEQAAEGLQPMAIDQPGAQPAAAVMAAPEEPVKVQQSAAVQADAQQQQQAAAQREQATGQAPSSAAVQVQVQPVAGTSAPATAAQPPELPPTLPVIFPLHEYERLSAQLQQFGRQSGINLISQQGLIPQPTLRAARGQLRTLPSPHQVEQLYARLPRFLERALLPFQREGVLCGLAHNGRCLIADEMGVGKTVQAIALASCYQDEWPLLVIVPASLRLVWAEELEKWLPHLRPSCIHVIEGKEHRVAQGCVPLVCITSYEMMQRLTCDACKGRGGPHASMCAGQRPPCADPQNCMASLRWRVVIVDESHTLRTSSKPPDALHTEAVVSALRLSKRAILLTGTPSLSRPFDLFRQVDAIMPGLLGRSRIDFATAYCNRREVPLPGFHAPGERSTRMDVSGLSRGAELHDMLKAEVMLRRLKKDVLSQLPPKRRQVIRLPKPPPSEWPKLPKGRRRHADDSEGSASDGGEDEGDGEEGEDAEGGGGGQGGKPTSAAHRTGLAKCSSVIDWLMTALGVRSGGRSGSGGSRRGQGAAGGRDGQNLCKLQAEDEEEGGSGGGEPGGGGDAPRFLVFAHHKTVMNRLAAALEGASGYAPVGYVRIDGGTDPEDRHMAVRRFRSDASVRVALLSVTAAGVGLDFSSASVVVFAELPDEVALVLQAEDRAHRQGQSQPVNVYFLCAKGTTDDRRWQALNRSLARVAAVHDGAGLRAPASAAAKAAARAAAAAARGDGGGAAAAVTPGARQGGATPQAGLVVECVYDAEAAGITPAAAKAGLAAGLESGAQADDLPVPTAGANAAGAAAGVPAGAAAGTAAGAAGTSAAAGSTIAAAGHQHIAACSAAEAQGAADASPAREPGSSPAAAAAPATVFAEAAAAASDADTSLLAPTPPGLGLTTAGALIEAPASSFVAATDEPPSAAPPASVAAAAGMAAGSPAATSQAAARSPPGSGSHRWPMRGHSSPSLQAVAEAEAAGFGSPVPCANMQSGPNSPAATQPEQPPEPAEVQVWFEVSGNTGRVHLHAAGDGSAPLRLSLPMEALLAGDSPILEELLEALSLDSGPPSPVSVAAEQQGQQQQQQGQQQGQQQEQQQQGQQQGQQQQGQQQQQQQQQGAQQAPSAGVPAALPSAVEQQQGLAKQQQGGLQEVQGKRQRRPAVVGGIGVLALDRHISAARLAAMLAEAREFAAEWRELRGLHQSRLQGRVLRVPLQEAVDEVDQAAAAAGKLGVSTNRFVDTQRSDLALPPGAEWRPVRVAFKRYGKECDYQQPFMLDGARLCINCAKAVPGKAAALPADTVLDGMTLLFCSGECEGRFALKSNGSAYRRALFRLERGVCVKCRLDCHALVKRLQAVEKGSRDWEEQRRRIIAARAPRLVERGYKAHLDLLVHRAVEGNAWQADHILPVYKGGGLCDVDNLRTLCVACHADVTKEQAKERAAGRRQAKAAGAGGGGGQLGWEDVAREGGQPVVKRRKKLQRTFMDAEESDGAEGWLAAPSGAVAGKQVAAPAAAGPGQEAQQGFKRRPRNRLKPLFVESESEGAEMEAAPAETEAAAVAGSAGAEQPPAAAAASVAAEEASAGDKLARPRGRLKPLFMDSEEEQPGDGLAAGAAAAAAAAGNDATGTSRSRHRLARSSTADAPLAADAGAACRSLPLGAVNTTPSTCGNTAGGKRPHAAVSGAEAVNAGKPKVERKACSGSRAVLDDNCQW
ncbi:hypothetical protein ABPG75_002175 [Micractinium tetrahymenae]